MRKNVTVSPNRSRTFQARFLPGPIERPYPSSTRSISSHLAISAFSIRSHG